MHSHRLQDVVAIPWRHRRLIFQLARRDVVGRYRGSYLGLFWSFFQPLLMLAVYTLVFGMVFKARWTADAGSQSEFAVVLFTGLLVYGIFSESVNRAPGLILGRANFVKRIVFPLEILPWVALCSGLFHAGINLLVLVAATALVFHAVPWTWLLIVPVLLPLLLFTLGIAWALAAIGVYVRDVAQTVGVLTAALMFVSPIFYPVSAVPDGVRFVLHANPLTFIIETARDVLLWGRMPDWTTLALYTAGAALVAWAGLAIFQRWREGFADVL